MKLLAVLVSVMLLSVSSVVGCTAPQDKVPEKLITTTDEGANIVGPLTPSVPLPKGDPPARKEDVHHSQPDAHVTPQNTRRKFAIHFYLIFTW
eukprot:TRINITY_DN6362_c0_g2_i1.p1 TRINITY_DN6362_c0_g2~~TRINITY_DN6362_c0_g2_i1.p1  ORF type:complete len:109 (+),score=19.46 TRINITY_DN6362_c0_g2_i1:50-328(+)